MNWHKNEIDTDKVRELSGRFGCTLLMASILVRRGVVDYETVKFYLETDPQFLHNPFLFTEMEDVVDRILLAAEEGEKVKIFGDRDVDGITSTVLMREALTELGIEAEWQLPSGDDPYGLTLEAVEDFAARDGSLFITVDCGISNTAEIARAAEIGIDTIIIDHHIAPEELPPAYAIINPKMEDSGYPFPHLAACGVVAKVVWALRFGKLDLYNDTFCLLNIRPGNEAYILEAVKLTNLVEVDRLTETLVPGVINLDQTRLTSFFSHRILVYGGEAQTKMLQALFGRNAEINLIDTAPEIWKSFPSLEGRSLLKLREASRSARYATGTPAEIDVFLNLFTAYIVKTQPGLGDDYMEILDLVALGTIADMMPLEDENRIIVQQGMRRLCDVRRPGLKALLALQNLNGRRLSTTDVGWQITPVINATGRLGVPHKAVELLSAEDPAHYQPLAEEVLRINKERKKMGEDNWKKVMPAARRSFDEMESRMVMVADKEIHRGITGILASRLTRFFGVPAMAVALMEDKAVGSIRSNQNINVKAFLGDAEEYFIDYGGHNYAAGFSVEHSRFSAFQKRIRELSRDLQASGDDGEEVLNVDAELPLAYMTPDLLKVVEAMEPYGEGNPPLVFMTSGITVQEISLIGKTEKSHLRLLLDSGQYRWPAVFWNAAERANRDFAVGDRVRIVFRLGRNYFQNREKLQLTLLDVKK